MKSGFIDGVAECSSKGSKPPRSEHLIVLVQKANYCLSEAMSPHLATCKGQTSRVFQVYNAINQQVEDGPLGIVQSTDGEAGSAMRTLNVAPS